MRRHRVQQRKQRPELALCHRIFLIKFIHESHHRRDRRIIFQIFEIAAHFLDGLVHLNLHIFGVIHAVCQNILQLPHSLKESAASLHAILTPACAQLKSADKHLVCPQGIRTVLYHNIIGIHHIAKGFGHLDNRVIRHLSVFFLQSCLHRLLAAMFSQKRLLLRRRQIGETVGIQSQNHAVGCSLRIRLRTWHRLLVIEELMPEPGI